ncbi:MAG TPA: aquaporin [Dongiaceae bacterium]|nr:aquaporin [Dongiaceae bacterium]
MATKKATSTKKKAPVKKTTTSKASTTTVKTVPATAKKETLGDHVETSLKSARLWRALAAEFIGTFLLASVVIAGQGQPIFVLFALVGVVLLIGGISGGYVNPALTVGAWVTRRMGWLRALGYIFVQFLGAAVAYFVFSAFVGGATQPSASAAAYGQTAASVFKAVNITTLSGKEWYIFFSELLGTAVLAFAVANATRLKDRLTASWTAGTGIFIGLMVAATVGGYVSASAIINPAIALSLQAFQPSGWPYIVYVLGPVIGGVVGFLIYDLLRGKADRA